MNEDKEYINKELYGQTFEEFAKSIEHNLLDSNFTEQLEWSMMMVQTRFKSIRARLNDAPITPATFNNAFLISSGVAEMKDGLGFLSPFGNADMPKIFPNLNVRIINIGDVVTLRKFKALPMSERNNLYPIKKNCAEITTAYYQFGNDSFYTQKEGWQYNDRLFDSESALNLDSIPHPLSLRRGERYANDSVALVDPEWLVGIKRTITMSYSIAMTMYYEWCVCVRDSDSIGIIFPIDPSILKDLYNGSASKFETRKQMITFIRDHYRRKSISANDYSVYVSRYLRGEKNFNYRGFTVEIIPPRYDLDRVKTKKQFIDALA